MAARRIGELQELSRFVRFVAYHPSGIGNRLSALARFVVRQVHKRITGHPLLVGWEGFELAVGTHSTSAAAAYYLGRSDWWEFDFIERFVRPGDTVVDVGANVGVYSLFLAKAVGPDGVVVASEPDPENAAALQENLSRNRLHHVRILQTALGDHDGVAPFKAGLRTVSRFANPGDGDTVMVRMTTLDSVLGTAEPVFVKIDVEGFEDAVIRGSRALMQRGFPKVWQLEVDARRVEQSTRLAAALAPFGYRFLSWDPAGARLSPCSIERAGGNNLLAAVDLDAVQARLMRAQ